MSFPAYPDYKDSGVAWLGSVPSHWSIGRTKDLFEIKKRIAGELGHDVLSITQSGLRVKDIESNEGQQAMDYSKYQLVYPGNFAMNHMDLLTGWIDIADQPGVTSPDYRVFETRNLANVDDRFFLRVFQMAYAARQFYPFGQGSSQLGRWRLPTDAFYAFPVPIPPAAEQTAIAAFLDRETAKVDALFAEQERLIALLKEKRQAVISNAVTKGLNPDSYMKGSDIEWLGEIPAHWDRVQLGRLCRQVSDGPHFSPPYVDDGYMFLSARNIRVDGWSLDDAKYVDQELFDEFCRRVVPERGDVLYTKGGTTGVARAVDFDTPFQVWVHVAVLKIIREIAMPEYVAYALNSSGCYEQSQLHTRGATNQDLGLTRMIRIWLALPPLEEQHAIVRALDDQLGRIDEACNAVSNSMALLNERRAALISAAVTGKIDVRGQIVQSNVASFDSVRPSLPPLRALVGAYAIRELGPMGRMAVMKAGYLAEGHAGFTDLNGRYERFAAGPYDQNLISAMERGAEEICGIGTNEAHNEGRPVTYDVPKDYSPPAKALSALVGDDRMASFLAMLSLLKGIGRDGVEAVATIYAVWNDLLAAGKAAGDDPICNGVLNDWHPEKIKKFKRSDLDHWLAWMRRNNFVPNGSAPRTDHQGSLFT